jgi:hypothetical protein
MSEVLLKNWKHVLVSFLVMSLALKLALPETKTYGEDLVQDYLSARALIAGQSPYQDLVKMRADNGFPPTLPDPVPSNPHPPLGILLVLPIAWVKYDIAFEIWKLLNVLALSLAWTWAWRTFAHCNWLTAVAGGVVGLWAPVWQGLDFGQPSGFLAAIVVLLWQAARHNESQRCGLLLGLAWVLRPFLFLCCAAGFHWKKRTIVISALIALLTVLASFALLGKSPWVWWQQNASESAQYASICGTFGRALGWGSTGGMALYGLCGTGLAYFQYRTGRTDETFALSIAGALLFYPIAWYHYDGISIPVLIWLGGLSHQRDSRIGFLTLLIYILCRAFPSTQQMFLQMMWLQIIGRSSLFCGILWLICHQSLNKNTHP